MKWNEQPHPHLCPLHNVRSRCEVIPCPDPYVMVCRDDHPREMIQDYVVRTNRRHNEDLRDEQRNARDAYTAGREAMMGREGD